MRDVVLFVGPPFAGKTAFYHQVLSECYVRLSAAEIYSKDSSANLRIIIKRIVSEIEKGHNLVIDDENIERRTRLSYINGISKKISGTTFTCYHFVPLHGVAQLHICKEWHFARQCLDAMVTLDSPVHFLKMKNVSSRIDSHSVMCKDLCLDADRFLLSKQVTVPLICHSSHKLTSPLLVIHWEGMIENKAGQKDCSIRKGVRIALQKWSSVNKCGQIVVVCESKTMEKLMATLLLSMVVELSLEHPIHYTVLGDPSDPGRPPNTGFATWLQYLFAASVCRKSSLCVYHTKAQHSCAQALPVKNITASKLFTRPLSVNSVHYTEHEAHSILSDVTYLSDNSSLKSRDLPLYHLARLLSESPDKSALDAHYDGTPDDGTLLRYSIDYGASDSLLSGRQVSAEFGAGRILGMVYKDFESLEQLQGTWSRSLTPVTDTLVDYSYFSEQDATTTTTADTSVPLEDKGRRDDNTPVLLPKEEQTAVSQGGMSCSNRSLPTWIHERMHECDSEVPGPSKRVKCEARTRSIDPKPLTETELLKTAAEVLAQRDDIDDSRQSTQPSPLSQTPNTTNPISVDLKRKPGSPTLCSAATSGGSRDSICKQDSTVASDNIAERKHSNASDSFLDELFM